MRWQLLKTPSSHAVFPPHSNRRSLSRQRPSSRRRRDVRGQAQDWEGPSGTLRGGVIDEAFGDPLQGATVALWQETEKDSTLLAATVMGEDGRFSFEEVPMNTYTARIRFFGYADRRFP